MSRKRGKPKTGAFLVSLFLSSVLLAAGGLWIPAMDADRLFFRLFLPLLRLMGFITIGLFAGQWIEAMGWTRSLAVVARPFFRFGRLGERCSAAFTTAFMSGAAANAMLLGFYEEGKITRKQLFLSNFVNQFPAYFLHLPTTFFIVLPLTGRAGVLYYLLTFLATLLRTFCFLVFGRLNLPETGKKAGSKKNKPVSKNGSGFWEEIRRKLPARVMNIAVFVLPIYIAVFMLNLIGIFQQANDFLAHHLPLTILPVESLSVVILSFAAEFTSGFAAAGAMMDAGLITVKQTVLALLIGNVLAFPIRALRHQLPRYMGIFSPRMGAQILLMGQGFRVLSLGIVGYLYYWVT